MPYQKTEWNTGDIVTAAKLNNIENGIASAGSGVLMVHGNFNETTGVPSLDKTWQEIYDAVEADKIVAFKMAAGGNGTYINYAVGSLSVVYNSALPTPEYSVIFYHNGEFRTFVANNPNEYPVFTAVVIHNEDSDDGDNEGSDDGGGDGVK